MKFGITAKLFIAILATNVVTALAVGLALRETFTHGFRDYLGQREERRLERLADSLARAYEERGSWEFLRGDDALWAAFDRPPRDGGFGPPPMVAPGRDPRLRPPPPPEDMPPPRRAPPPGPPPPDQSMQGPPPGAPGEFPRDPRSSRVRPDSGPDGPPPTLLLDAQKLRVVGRLGPGSSSSSRSIVVNGTTVGYLSTNDAPSLDALDMRFRDDQLRATWIIAALVMLLATLVAIVLARRFLAPVRRLADATHRLASGEYATRVAPTSRDELGQLVDDFNRLARTLENNETLRRNFMADVSHELRTPLAVLKGELEALQDGIREFTPESLRSLQAEVAMLSKLVSDVYDLALADVGALAYRFEVVDVAALLGDVLRAFGERFASRRLSLSASLPDAPLNMTADPHRLTQLFNNLLENSIRYTDAGGSVAVTLRRERGSAHFDFEDSAPAVPEAMLPRLFERLFRVDASRSRERGGAGLGLSIGKSVVDAHRGTIVAKASRLGGLWIEVRLPLAPGDSVA